MSRVADIRKHPWALIDDSQGEVIDIRTTPDEQPIKVMLPKQPLHKDMLFYDKKKSEQYWRRQEPPVGLTQNTESRYVNFIKSELKKIREGVWFLNNGIPTYMTGLHYYYVNYIEIDVGYPDYRERDRKFFYVWKMIEDHPALKGLILIKPRRMGASWVGTAILLHKLTVTKKALGGILSKSGKDAKEFFTEKLVIAWQSLPFWLQPLTSSGSDPKTALLFNKPSDRSKESAKKGNDTSVGLRSKIDYRPTKLRSYDSMKLVRLVYDEVGKIEGKVDSKGKWVGVNLSKQWGVLKKTLGLRNKVGVAYLPSTVGDLSEGGEQFKKLVASSLLSNMTGNGSTPTGLLAYFIPAYDGLEGFIDRYGISIIKDPKKPLLGIDGDYIAQGSKTYLDNERAGILDPNDLIEEKREMPYNLKEAFYDKAGESIFNLGKIQTQIDWLEESNIEKLTTRGYFSWKGGVKDSTVQFNIDEKGAVEVSHIPKYPNQFATKGGKRHPVNHLQYAGGIDSYDIDKPSWGGGSNGAMAIFSKQSSNTEVPEENKNSFVMTYIAREPKAPLFYEQCIMAAVYYSSPILIENNKPRILHYFESRGYKEYCAVRPDKAEKDLTKNERELRGMPSNEQTVVDQGEVMQSYIIDEIGMKENGAMGRCYHYDLLEDWRKFQLSNRTPYDISVGSMLALVLANKFVMKVRRVEGTTKGLFQEFDYSSSNTGSAINF